MTSDLQNCTAVVLLLDAYHDDELSSDEKASVEGHLRHCEPCSQRLAAIDKLVATLKSMPSLAPREDFADKFEMLLKENKLEIPGEKTDRNQKIADRQPDGKRDNVVFKKFGWVAAVAASVVIFAGVSHYATQKNGISEIAKAPVLTTPNQVSKALQKEQLANATIGTSEKAPDSDADAHKTESSSSQPKSAVTVASAHKSLESPGAPEKVVAANNTTLVRKDGAADERKPSVATAAKSDGNPSHDVPQHSLVAFYEPETNSIPEELGISTDEDGLYAIKM